MRLSAAATLRQSLRKGKCIAAPGVSDALTGRLAQQAGFAAVYMTGLGATATRLGMPDLGLMTQTEMLEHATNMVRVLDIPVIADADTGYGGELNIRRTVRDYSRAGVAALHIEDQLAPKRCGQLAGIRLEDAKVAARRLEAAVASCEHDEIVVIGRTDALRASGITEAVERAMRYADTGVDLVFIDGVRTRAEVDEIASLVTGPKVVSLVDGTDAARLTIDDLAELGFSLVLFAVTTLFAAAAASARALEHLSRFATPHGLPQQMSYDDFCTVVGLEDYQAFARRYET